MSSATPRTRLRAWIVTLAVLATFAGLVAAVIVGRELQLRPIEVDALDAARVRAAGVVVEPTDLDALPATVPEARVCTPATSAEVPADGGAIGWATPDGAVTAMVTRIADELGPGSFEPTAWDGEAIVYTYVRDDTPQLAYEVVAGPNDGWVIRATRSCE